MKDEKLKVRLKEKLKRFNPRKLALTILISALIAAVYMAQPYRLGAAWSTKSINCRAFIWEKRHGDDPPEYKKGDYVTFMFQREDLAPEYYEFFKKMKFVKKVGCAPGDFLDCGFGVCACNGEIILSSISEKFAAQAFNYSGAIPPTHVFLIGDNEQSYDGRYWGLTHVRSLLGTIRQCLYASEK